MKNKKKIAFGAAALAVVMVAAGTFAWFSTTDKTNPNVFGMDNFDVTITEEFDTPDVPLLPGADITKEVGVTNGGNVPVVVRVKLEEALELLTPDTAEGVDKLKVEYADNKEAQGAQVPVLVSQKMLEAYKQNGYTEYPTNAPEGITVLRKETKNDGENKNGNTVYSYLAYVTAESALNSGSHHLAQVLPQGTNAAAPTGFTVKYAYNLKKDEGAQQYIVNAIHGKTGDDAKLDAYYSNKGQKFHEAVVLNFAENVQTDGQALSQTAAWYLATDGYFYYTKTLEGETISAPLLQSVTIKKDAGNALKGATYTITPVMEAVQVNWDAVKASWAELTASQINSVAVVGADSAGQLVYNIVNNGGVAYYAGA